MINESQPTNNNSKITNSRQLATSSRRPSVPAWHWHRRLYDWVVHWADTKFGVLALIILAIVEPVCVPIPADVLVIGLCLGKPKKSIHYGLICSFFSVIGGTIAFLLGLAIGGERVVHFCQQISFGSLQLGQTAQKALEIYAKYDFWAVAIAALTPVPYLLFSWLGGMADISLLKFIVVSVIFRTMRFGGEGVIFYFLGQKARRMIEKYFNIATFIVIIFLILIAYSMKKISQLF